MLIVLDNCEHLLDASAELITALLGACPVLTLLTTSREPIGVTARSVGGCRRCRWPTTRSSCSATARAGPSPTSGSRADNSRGGDRDLPQARRPAAGHRTGRGTCARPVAGRDPGQPARPVPAADGRRPHRGAPPADPARIGGLVARPADRARTGVVPQAGGVLRRVRSRRRAGCRRRRRWSATRCSTSSRCWSTSRSWSPRTAGMEPATGCWKPSVSTRRRSCASPVKATTCGPVTATTTPRWRPLLDGRRTAATKRRIERAEAEIDNLRAAFAWSLENVRRRAGAGLASSLQPLWLTRGRIQEGLNWLGAALADDPQSYRDVGGACAGLRGQSAAAVLYRHDRGPRRRRANPGKRTGTRRPSARGAGADRLRWPRPARPRGGRSRTSPRRTVSRETSAIHGCWGRSSHWMPCRLSSSDEPADAQAAAEEGLRIADSIGDAFVPRQCRFALGWAHIFGSDLSGAPPGSVNWSRRPLRTTTRCSRCTCSLMRASALAYSGMWPARERRQRAASNAFPSPSSFTKESPCRLSGIVHLAAGDASAAWEAWEAARERTGMNPQMASIYNWAALARVGMRRSRSSPSLGRRCRVGDTGLRSCRCR